MSCDSIYGYLTQQRQREREPLALATETRKPTICADICAVRACRVLYMYMLLYISLARFVARNAAD